MINTVERFTKTADLADGFSDLILALYDREAGMHAQSAMGLQALPINLPCFNNQEVGLVLDLNSVIYKKQQCW